MDNYNINRKVVNFKDFDSNSEKDELEKVQRSTIPNSDEKQQHIGNRRFKFNKVTRKMDDLSPAEIQDNLDAIDELEDVKESRIEIKDTFVTMDDEDDEIQPNLNIKTSDGQHFMINLKSFDDFDD